MSKPNVIIIMADQLRNDVIGERFTPHIHALKQESVVMERAYCASPLCVPARGSFFTGLYPNCHGSLMNPGNTPDRKYGLMRAGTMNLYRLLEREWDSRHVGKQHVMTEDRFDRSGDSATKWHTTADYKQYLSEQGRRTQGGSLFRGMSPELVSGRYTRMKSYSIPAAARYEEGFDYSFDGYIAGKAVEAIRSREPGKPLLLNVMFLAPHPPFDVPEPWFSMVTEAELPDNVGVWYDDQSPLQLHHLPGAIGTRYSRDDWKRIWPVYLGLAGMLDHCVGLIINELKAQGIYDDSLIVFTSDHGEMLGSHCLWQKNCMYEEATRIPLAFKLPKRLQASIEARPIGELVSAVDVLPTLCDLLEVEPPERLSGVSLVPLMAEGKKLERDRIFIQYDGNQARGHFQRCIVKNEHKLIADFYKDELYLELYAVTRDPQETGNQAFEPHLEPLVRELLDDLRRHMQATGDLIELPIDAYEQFIARKFLHKH